jgi:hypothetical protein
VQLDDGQEAMDKVKSRPTGFPFVCGCALLLSAGYCTSAAEQPDKSDPPGYVVAHWKKEFAAVEKEIEEKRTLYERGEDPYEKQRILDSTFLAPT